MCVQVSCKFSPREANLFFFFFCLPLRRCLPALRVLKQALCRKGIPPHFRERIWMLRSGAEEKMKAAGPLYYENLKHRVTEWLERAPFARNGVEKNGLGDLADRGIGESISNVKIKEAFKSVDGDVPRTFPGHRCVMVFFLMYIYIFSLCLSLLICGGPS